MIDDAEFHEIANVTSDGNLGSVVEERHQLTANNMTTTTTATTTKHHQQQKQHPPIHVNY